MLHLAEGTPLLPEDRLMRTRVLEWMCFEQTHVDGVISGARFRRQYPDPIPTREEEFVAWHAEGHQALAMLDEHLRARAFLVGDRFTLADIALYAYTHCASEGGFDLIAYPSLAAWFARIRAERGHVPINWVPPEGGAATVRDAATRGA
jgi:glutathione S-transferase